MKIKRTTVRTISAFILAVMVFVQTNVAGLGLSDEAKSWAVFAAGAAIAGLTTLKLQEDDTVPLEQYNRVVEDSSLAETARLNKTDT